MEEGADAGLGREVGEVGHLDSWLGLQPLLAR